MAAINEGQGTEDEGAARSLDDALAAGDLLAGSDLRIGLTLTETGSWAAFDDLVGDYGEGETCADAVRDLLVSMFEHRDLLREHESALVPRLKQELDTLNRALRDEMLSPVGSR